MTDSKNIIEALNEIDHTLFVVVQDNTAYIIDKNKEGDEEFDYGIYTTLSVEELKNGTLSFPIIDLIPDANIENLYDIYEEDELKEMFEYAEKITQYKPMTDEEIDACRKENKAVEDYINETENESRDDI